MSIEMLVNSGLIETDSFYNSIASCLNSISDDYSEIVLFDIETTGFSSSSNICYLIGAVHFVNKLPHYTQWFAETPKDEADIISAFSDFLMQFRYIISFNGDAFDIPFLLSRASKLNVTLDFSIYKSLDLYKIARYVKKLISLENYRQKSIERFLGINREDKYSGGELIEVYKHYLAFKQPSDLDLLLLHNHDDCKGMLPVTLIISYAHLLNTSFSISNIALSDNYDRLVLSASLQCPVPVPISLENDNMHFEASEKCARLSLSIAKTELKYFRSDYGNYYYLPNEDNVVHKSIATFVDPKSRVKANKKNCYTRKTGFFLAIPPKSIDNTSNVPLFKQSYESTDFFIEFTDDLLNDTSFALSCFSDFLHKYKS